MLELWHCQTFNKKWHRIAIFYQSHRTFLLVTELIDNLVDDGRVVVLSSGAHYYAAESGLELDNLSGEKDYNDWRMYGRSKLANIYLPMPYKNDLKEAIVQLTLFIQV